MRVIIMKDRIINMRNKKKSERKKVWNCNKNKEKRITNMRNKKKSERREEEIKKKKERSKERKKSRRNRELEWNITGKKVTKAYREE